MSARVIMSPVGSGGLVNTQMADNQSRSIATAHHVPAWGVHSRPLMVVKEYEERLDAPRRV